MLQRTRPLPDSKSNLDAPRDVPMPPSLDCGIDKAEVRDETQARSATPSYLACAVCEAMQGSEAHYAQRVLPDPRHVPVNAQAVADALGFCHLHVGHVLAPHERASAVGTVMHRALGLLRPLLEARNGTDDHAFEVQDHVLEILFAARSGCPACSFAERRLTGLLARHAAELRSGREVNVGRERTLCVPHFRALIGFSALSDLADWVEMEVEALACAEARLQRDEPCTVRALVRIIAGRRARPPQAVPGIVDCPVCVAMRAAKERWLELARGSVRADAAPSLIMPSCPEHIWDCHDTHDAGLAAFASRIAFNTVLDHLRRAAVLLRHEERKLEESKRSVWYKKKSPAYILGHRRALVTKAPVCPACERIAVARDAAINRLLEELRHRQMREDFERGPGLCIKHYALARIIAPAGAVREAIEGTQLRRLSVIENKLSRSPADAWREAVIYLSDSSRS